MRKLVNLRTLPGMYLSKFSVWLKLIRKFEPMQKREAEYEILLKERDEIIQSKEDEINRLEREF